MSLFEICHANYPHNLLRLACLDSEKDLLNLSMTKIRACYDLTGVFEKDKDLLFSLFYIKEFISHLSFDGPLLENGLDHYAPLYCYFNNLRENNPKVNAFFRVMDFVNPDLWENNFITKNYLCIPDSKSSEHINLWKNTPNKDRVILFNRIGWIECMVSQNFWDLYEDEGTHNTWVHNLYLAKKQSNPTKPSICYQLDVKDKEYCFVHLYEKQGTSTYQHNLVYKDIAKDYFLLTFEDITSRDIPSREETNFFSNPNFNKFIVDFYNNHVVMEID